MTGRSFAVAATARALSEPGLATVAGGRGVLLECWDDAEAVRLLRLLAGLAEPSPGSAAGRFFWIRDRGRPDRVMLEQPVLGVRPHAPAPGRLAAAVEHLARTADRHLPRVQEVLERTPAAPDLAVAMARRMRTLLVLAPVGAPAHVGFDAADAPEAGGTVGAQAGEGGKAGCGVPRPEVEDHRPGQAQDFIFLTRGRRP